MGYQDLIPESGRSPGDGNGNPLRYSCLENPTDRGAWQATVHGVAKSQTWLIDFTHNSVQKLEFYFTIYIIFCKCGKTQCYYFHIYMKKQSSLLKIFFFLTGYHCEYKMRTGRKPDGCAVCFKHSRFSLLSVNPVEFYRRDVPLLDRDNVGLVLLLQPKIPSAASPAICVANTHLLYNPRRGDIKLTQLAMLLAEISSVARQKDGSLCPIIMCGDFNSVPGSPLYSFIKEGKLNYEGLAIGKVRALLLIRRWV